MVYCNVSLPTNNCMRGSRNDVSKQQSLITQ